MRTRGGALPPPLGRETAPPRPVPCPDASDSRPRWTRSEVPVTRCGTIATTSSANLATIRDRDRGRVRPRRAGTPRDVLLVAAAKTRARRGGPMGGRGRRARDRAELRQGAPRDRTTQVPGARWHFIGTLQTSTAHHVAALADVVETLAGQRATERLARRAADAGRRLDALIEVDLTGDRSGVATRRAPRVRGPCGGLEGLRLRGLMTLPPLTDDRRGGPAVVPAAPRPARSHP